RQKQMQDAGVVGVFHILGVELPVVRQDLGAAAEDTRRTVQYAADTAGNLRPEIGLQIGRVLAERTEHQAGEFGDAQPLQIMLVLAEFGRHAALPLDAALERDAGQFAAQIIGPAVINAAEFLRIAAPLETQEVAAMRAAIKDGVYPPFAVAHYDDGSLADRG